MSKRSDWPEKDAVEVRLAWQHDKSILMRVDGTEGAYFWGPEEIVENLDDWAKQYMCRDADGWPRVVEDCTGEGLELLRPFEFEGKLLELQLERKRRLMPIASRDS